MESRFVDRASRSLAARYGVGIAAAFLGLLIRLPVAHLLGDKVPYITFFLATTASAMLGGVGPAIVTTVLGALLAALFIVPPLGSLIFTDPYDYLGLAIFLGVSGIISYLAGRLIDATQKESALRILLEQTLVSIGDAVISTDQQKRIRMVNRAAEHLTGWTVAEVTGKSIDEVFRIVREGSDTPVEDPIETVLKTGLIVGLANHTELITKSGTRIPIDDSGAPIINESGALAGAVLVFRDISARREAERNLEVAERRARTILESITDAFILLDHEWRYAYVNPAAETLMRTPAASLIGKIHWNEHPATLGTPVETLYRRAMADNVPVHFDNYYAPWDQWCEISAYPSREGLSIYFRDITERKRAQATLQRLNEELTQFTFAVTHDLREPIRTITAYVQMLQRKLGEQLDDESREYISYIVSAGQRISRLIDGLLQFSRLGDVSEIDITLVSADAAMKETVDDLRRVIQETNASVHHDELPQVMANHVHLCQLFQNLVSNALKYHKPGVAPHIKISAKKEREEWVFSVQDNGIGVAPEHQAQIFVPFKRLHGSEISGVGIGLATCRRIIERYGGRIWIESEDGRGSTFYFSLRDTDVSARGIPIQ